MYRLGRLLCYTLLERERELWEGTLVKITSEIFVQVKEHPDVDESVVLDIQMFFLLFAFRVG